MSETKRDRKKEILEEATVYTTQEVADILNLDLRTIYRMIKDKRIRAVKVLNEWRIRHIDLIKYLDELEDNA